MTQKRVGLWKEKRSGGRGVEGEEEKWGNYLLKYMDGM